jgi:hypothetical protein
MATSSHTRAFQAYNSQTYKNHPATRNTPITTTAEPLVFGRIPYASIKTTIETISSSSTSPNSVVKPVAMIQKRHSSAASLGHLLSRPKSSQMTALATRRQNLWMSIAKNAQINSAQSSPIPIQQTSLMRKKLLRFLLVFSYLLSISLFAIALATFYGFFWSGYDTTQTATTGSNVIPTFGIVSLTKNSTLIGFDFSLEDVSQKKSIRREKAISSFWFYRM